MSSGNVYEYSNQIITNLELIQKERQSLTRCQENVYECKVYVLVYIYIYPYV